MPFLRPALFLLGLLLAAVAGAQLRQVHVDLTAFDNNISKVSFFTPAKGWIGSTGTASDWIGYTSDSGHTFARKPITLGNVDLNGYAVNLTFGFSVNGVQAFSEDTVLVFGDYGFVPAILHSTNGGNTFKLVFHSQYNQFQLRTGITDMIFPGVGSTGYAVDADRILRSTDRGKTWSAVYTSPGIYFNSLEAPDANNVFAFNNVYGDSRILRGTNGGTIWQPVSIPNNNWATRLTYVHFLTSQKGWLGLTQNSQGGEIYYTTNGGTTWSLQNDAGVTPFNGGKFKFVNDSTGYALSMYDVYKTVDTGKRWELLPRDNDFEYLGYGHNDIQCLNAQQFWAAGGRDFIQLSTNGGGTPLPKAFFKADTTGVLLSGTVKLFSYSKRRYSHRWIVNGAQTSTGYNSTYTHDIARSSDTVRLIVSNGQKSDTLEQVLYFYVPPIPFITGIMPATGSTGTRIRINGSNFSTVTSVRFGGTPASSFTIVSDNRIDAVVAGGATGTVSVVNVFGTISIPGFTYYAPPAAAPPVVASFSPASGTVGIPVTISGSNFNSGAAGNVVYFGAVRATVTSASATQIVCNVPTGTTYAPITVLHTGNGLIGRSDKPFTVKFADSSNFTANSFTSALVVDYGYPNGFKGALSGDVDGDGKPDIITMRTKFSYDSI
ncbi:MAG: hypothetical protein EOO16_02380 [Chitinophagaceae bacterium]|nr:MAG: hypothetical protein EOO16_02380 [Chitinophagaceae bacterium]